jgi:hypothetical protein
VELVLRPNLLHQVYGATRNKHETLVKFLCMHLTNKQIMNDDRKRVISQCILQTINDINTNLDINSTQSWWTSFQDPYCRPILSSLVKDEIQELRP